MRNQFTVLVEEDKSLCAIHIATHIAEYHIDATIALLKDGSCGVEAAAAAGNPSEGLEPVRNPDIDIAILRPVTEVGQLLVVASVVSLEVKTLGGIIRKTTGIHPVNTGGG